MSGSNSDSSSVCKSRAAVYVTREPAVTAAPFNLGFWGFGVLGFRVFRV